MLATVGLALAITGLAAAVLFAVGRHAQAPSPLATWAGLSVLRILAAPLLALASLVSAVLAPYRFPRLTLLAATVVEAGVSAYGVVVWFLPRLLPSDSADERQLRPRASRVGRAASRSGGV